MEEKEIIKPSELIDMQTAKTEENIDRIVFSVNNKLKKAAMEGLKSYTLEDYGIYEDLVKERIIAAGYQINSNVISW
jgi:hypothetical protein